MIENQGYNVNEMISKIKSANVNAPAGVNIKEDSISDSEKLNVWDHMESKVWALRLASDAAITILRVDQIIISKPAGGPKPK
jgi:T-complex protein 1 subunit theta